MSLKSFIFEWVEQARNSPGLASAPESLNRLISAARKSYDGMFAALHAPIAPMTWEERAILLGTDPVSERVAFKMPYAMEVVGFYPSVVQIIPAGGGAVIATTDDVDVSIDINNQNLLSNLEGISTSAPGATRGGTFVTLAGWGVLAPRLLGLRLEGPAPELGVTFRWKQPAIGGVPVYADALISMAIFVRKLDDRRSSNVPQAAREL